MQNLPPLIKAADLKVLMRTKQIVIIDARSGADAKDRYMAEHLDGALHVDLDKDLAEVKSDVAFGGRHPLPTLEKFSKVLTQRGITPETHVIIYDDKSGANAAARFWWMLKSVGHEDVQVLDGGLAAAVAEGIPLGSKEEKPWITKSYELTAWNLPQVTLNEVEKASQDKSKLIIDVRENDRYKGLREPIDLVAGHIPNAVNIPFSTNLDTNGSYLSSEELREKYLKVYGNKKSSEVIIHCGSGVTACHTLLALASAGIELPNLYVGSWSEWSRNNKPIATDKE